MKQPIVTTAIMVFAALLWLNLSENHALTVCIIMAISIIGIFLVYVSARYRKNHWLTISFFMLVVVSLIFCVFELNFTKVNKYVDTSVQIIGSVVDYPSKSVDSEFYSCQISIDEIDGENVWGSITLYFKANDVLQAAKAGDIVSFTTTPSEIYSESITMLSYYKSQGCYLSSFDISNVQLLQEQNPYNPLIFIKNMRYNITQTFIQDFDTDNAGVLISLLFGDKSQLSDKMYDQFISSGLAHIMAVSGLHMSIWVLFIMEILKKFKLDNLFTKIFLMLVVTLVMAFAGFTPSVVRAAIMLYIYLLSQIFRLDSNKENSLFLAGFLILLFNPYAALDIRFLLSFISTLAILYFAMPAVSKISFNLYDVRLLNIIRRTILVISSCVIITICTTFLSMPVSLITFGGISSVGVISNLAFLPILTPMILLAGGYYFMADIPFIGTSIYVCLQKLSEVSLNLVAKLSSWKYSYLQLDSTGITIAIIWVIAILVAILIIRNRFLFDYKQEDK